MELQLDRVTKQYGTKLAVDRMNLSMKAGVYGLLGANGAGKTTLMRLLCDILNPTSGEIRYDGQNIHVMGEEYRSLLGYLPQNFGYYPEFTAEKFMLYMAALKGLNRSFAKNRTEELLRLVGLEKEHRKKIKTFSGGMKRRLGIAQAMLNEPEILILDEPTAGLDPRERVRFRNLISSFSKDKIVLLSTHIVSDVEYIADEIFLMKEGQILQEGTPEEITAQMNGLVWECEVDEKRATELECRHTIVNMKKKNGAIELRIVSDTKPDEAAISVDATLEDMYLYYFEFQKIVGRKLIRVGLLAYGVLILIILSNSRVDFLDIFDQNGRHLHGKEALEYELKMAEQNRGPVTEEKVDALLAQEKQGAKNAGMNEAEYRLRTYWITGTAGAIWEEAPLSNPELQNSLQIGYTRGWETTLLSIESLFLIMGFLIIVAVSPVFSEEYGCGMDALLLTGKYGKTKCITAKIMASFTFSVVLTILTVFSSMVSMLWQYGTEGFEASLQFGSRGLFWEVPWEVSCFHGFLLVVGFGIAGAVLLSSFVLLVSAAVSSSFVSVLISILIYVLPIVLIFRFGLLSFDQFLSIMPSGDFNVAMLLSMQGVSVTGNEIPMWSINLLLTAAGVLAVLLGGRKIFGGHQVKSS